MADRFTQTEINGMQTVAKLAFQSAWKQIEFVGYPLVEEPADSGTFVEDEGNPTVTNAEYSDAVAGMAENIINEVIQTVFDRLNVEFPAQ